MSAGRLWGLGSNGTELLPRPHVLPRPPQNRRIRLDSRRSTHRPRTPCQETGRTTWGGLLVATAIQVVRIGRFLLALVGWSMFLGASPPQGDPATAAILKVLSWWQAESCGGYWPARDGGERQAPYQLLVAPAVQHGCEGPLVRQGQSIDEMQAPDSGATLFLTIKSHPTAACI